MSLKLKLLIPRLHFIAHNLTPKLISCNNSACIIMDDQPPNKKSCDHNGDSTTKIGTHNGTFHCDEVLACFLLQQLPQYQKAVIVRTRDPTLLKECDIVVDVGGLYDPEKNLFDHHQRSFNESLHSILNKKWTTKLSSAGLIYSHFGRQVIEIIIGEPIDENTLCLLFDKMYENFVEEIDAIDNGIDQFPGQPKYKVTSNISSRISHLNPNWNETDVDELVRFHKAIETVGAEFSSKLRDFFNVWLPARSIVKSSLDKRYQIDPSGEIILLERFCPWKEHLFLLEESENITTMIKYVLYQDSSNKWRIQCVPAGRNTFENRLSLLQEWRGLRDDELSAKCDIKGCVFVHATGFIGGNSTYEGVLEMARRCLSTQKT